MEAAIALLANLDFRTAVGMFWFYLLFDLPRYTLSTLAVGWQALFRTEYPLPPETLPISVLMVGHNEGGKLRRAAAGLREQTHGDIEIVVVDDGSTDATNIVGQRLLADGWIDRFVAPELRGGKSSALNLGLQHCSHEYVVVMDIDTSLDRDAVGQIVAPLLSDPRIGAVAGAIGVRNPGDSLMSQLQALEYTKTVALGRQFAAMFDILTIVSGAFGAFRKSAIDAVGGWDVGPGEDSDLTQKLRQAGWRIEFNPDAWALTDVPTTAQKFTKQRLRWNHSVVRERLRKFRFVFDPFNPDFRAREFVASLNVLLFHLVLNFAFALYIIMLFVYYGNFAFTVLLAVHILMFAGEVVEFVVAAIFVRRFPVLSWWPYLPLHMLFSAYFKRFVRLSAYVGELMFRVSYQDPFNPQKVRKAQDQV